MNGDEDPPVDQEVASTLARTLTGSSERAADLVRVHLEDYGEILAHLLAADVARWSARADLSASEIAAAGAAVEALCGLFVHGGRPCRTWWPASSVHAPPTELADPRRRRAAAIIGTVADTRPGGRQRRQQHVEALDAGIAASGAGLGVAVVLAQGVIDVEVGDLLAARQQRGAGDQRGQQPGTDRGDPTKRSDVARR